MSSPFPAEPNPQIQQPDMFQQIRKAHFKYAKCQGGNLHDGQILNLLCVDDRCLHRGLICPVCKMETHDDHFILPIKTFLSQIKDIIATSEAGDESTSLGGYIRAIQSTKRQLLNIVRQQINQLANLFKQIQLRIEESYLSIRRNIFIQSSSSTKLPKLLELLANEENKDPLEMQNQFRKYCEMIKYKDGKPKVTDKAAKLVNLYKGEPARFKTLGNAALVQYKKKVSELVTALEQQKSTPFLFSDQDKHPQIKLNEQKTEAWLGQADSEGIVVLNRPFTDAQNEVTFTIVKNQSFMISVGLGYISKLKSSSFSNSQDGSSMEVFIVSDGNTELSYHGQGKKCFEFYDDDRITVKIDADGKQCEFIKVGTNQTFKLPLKSDVRGNQEIRLCFGLGAQDRIKLQT